MNIGSWLYTNSTWVALVATLLVLGGLAYSIIKKKQLGRLNIFLIVWLLIFLFYLMSIGNFSQNNQLLPADWAQIWGQIILLGGLFVVTTAYAYSTEKMAREMREQRYAITRQLLDIQDILRGEDAMLAGLAAERGEFPEYLSCKLHNIGLGPAIDLYSYIRDNERNQRCLRFGTLAINGITQKMNLSLIQEDSRYFLIAFYSDIHGRTFKSSREVIIKDNKLEIEPLDINHIEGGKLID